MPQVTHRTHAHTHTRNPRPLSPGPRPVPETPGHSDQQRRLIPHTFRDGHRKRDDVYECNQATWACHGGGASQLHAVPPRAVQGDRSEPARADEDYPEGESMTKTKAFYLEVNE